MEAIAVDRLIEKAHFHSDVALAIAEAIDITIQAGNFVTVPVLDARLAVLEGKMEGRFFALEKSIASAKEWAIGLYASLVIALFSALAVEHHWLADREDHAIAQAEARSDQRFQQVDARFQQVDARFEKVDARFQQIDARFQQVDARFDRMDAELKEIRALLTPPHHRHSS